MNNFSLSASPKITLPETVLVDGNVFSINADFRVILNCLKLQTDTEILERDKIGILCRLFYVDRTPSDPKKGFETFMGFEPKDPDELEPQQEFCFEYDADVIYSSFLKEYKIDLLEVKFMHWKQFIILLKGLSPESPFNSRIRLRFMELKDLKGEDYAKANKAKQAVQLPIILTAEEMREQEEFAREWGE